MKLNLLSILSGAVAVRTTSPVPLSATAVAMAAAPSPDTHSSMNWLSKLKYYFKPSEYSQQQTLLGESFDRYLTNVVVQYQFSSAAELDDFKDAASSLVVDTWYLDESCGIVCLAASQIEIFDRLLPANLRESKSVTLSDVHRSVIRTFPLHNTVELPCQDFANASEVLRYEQQFPFVDLGHSWEGRSIRAVLPAEEKQQQPKSTLYVCGIHGREWASVSVCLSLLDSLGPTEAAIPLANPDGYHNSWSSDRLWSKNMQPTSLSFCPGHDLARGLTGSFDKLATQCSESYCGQGEESPLEVRAIQEYAKNFKRVVMIQGTERLPRPRVYNINNQTVRIALPDYGSSFLLARTHLGDAVRSVTGLVDSLRHSK